MRPATWSQYNQKFMPAELICFSPGCRARFAITEVLYNCPRCGGLLEASYPGWTLRARRPEAALARTADEQPAARCQRRLALPRDHPVPGRIRSRGLAAGRQHAAARRSARGRLRRPRPPHLQAPGLQSHRLVQGQRHDLRRGAGPAAGHEARGLRLHRQHLGLHGRLCQRRRPRAHHLHPARQHLLRQAGAGARIRRPNAPGGSQLRPDPGAGARARRAARHLPAELDQPLPHRRPEDHHRRDDGPARLAACRIGSCFRAATWATPPPSARRCARCAPSGSSIGRRAWP